MILFLFSYKCRFSSVFSLSDDSSSTVFVLTGRHFQKKVSSKKSDVQTSETHFPSHMIDLNPRLVCVCSCIGVMYVRALSVFECKQLEKEQTVVNTGR